ncbi:MAG: alanine--glyoxylate aminotransferase family protein [Rhodobacteraceae bacterium]|jgi:pyridoxamine--pyruvate transaminase|nr:alanine--glyoxylate aminotransferase family protein [Paracoccaceae bacterium]
MRYAEDRPAVLGLTTGPVAAWPEVLRAMARSVAYDQDRPFREFYAGVLAKARRAMRTPLPPVVLHGEPVLGLEAAAASLIAPGETVLLLVSGVYGKGFGGWARRHAGRVLELEVHYDDAIAPAAVEAMLARHPEVAVVAACEIDTPSGTVNPMPAIGAAVARHGAQLIVDAVSAFGGMDSHPAGCSADIYVAGPGKCLGAPPGLTLLGVSARAWAKMRANPAAPRGSFLSILDWEAAGDGGAFAHTPSIAEMYGLDAALDLYLAEGPEEVWARHAATARAMRAGVLAMGLSLWPAREAIAAPTVTAVRTPPGIDEAALRHEARARFGVLFSAGRRETLGRLTRIGHMGPAAQPIHAVAAVAALGGALAALGHPADAGAGVAAALAAIGTQ